MDKIRRFQNGLNDLDKVVRKIQTKLQTAGQQINNWLEEIGIESKDIDGIFEELSQNLYSNTKVVVDHNSQYGWTLAATMDPLAYIDYELIGKSKEELDAHFLNYYSEDDWNEYKQLKKGIKKHINTKWSELIDDCFFLFENHRYKSAIPIIFSIIEGEIAATIKSEKIGKLLVKEVKSEAESAETRFRKIVLYSITKCFQEALFISSPFNGDRKPVINRNWVLHGRDNPQLWEEVDVLRLLTVLNSIQFVQMMDVE